MTRGIPIQVNCSAILRLSLPRRLFAVGGTNTQPHFQAVHTFPLAGKSSRNGDGVANYPHLRRCWAYCEVHLRQWCRFWCWCRRGRRCRGGGSGCRGSWCRRRRRSGCSGWRGCRRRRWGIGRLYRRIVDYVDELRGGSRVVGSILVNKIVRRGDGNTGDHMLFFGIGVLAQVPSDTAGKSPFSGDIASREARLAVIGLGGSVDRSSTYGPCHLHRNGNILTARVNNIEVNPNVGAGLIIRWFFEYVAIVKIAQAPLRIDEDAHVVRACILCHRRRRRAIWLKRITNSRLWNQQRRQNGAHHCARCCHHNDGPSQNRRHRRVCGRSRVLPTACRTPASPRRRLHCRH